MSFHKFPLSMLIIGCLLCCGFLVTKADTIQTTKVTTVRTTGDYQNTSAPVQANVFVLPAKASYLVIDSKSGIVLGAYNTATQLLESGQALPAGALIVEKSSGRLVATADATGRVIDVYTVPATNVLTATIAERQSQLAQMIKDARAAGSINNEQAAAMQAELDRIAADTTASSLTYDKALLMGYNLDLLSDQLIPVVHVAQPITPIIPTEFIVVGDHLAMVDKVTYRRIAMERKIDNEYKAGRLSADNVSKLKSQLNQVASLESRYRGSGGQLSNSRERKLAMRLDDVQTSLDSNIARINKKRSQMGLIVN